jgi:hypothetical protein
MLDDLFDLIPAVRLAARADLERPEDHAGAHVPPLSCIW